MCVAGDQAADPQAIQSYVKRVSLHELGYFTAGHFEMTQHLATLAPSPLPSFLQHFNCSVPDEASGKSPVETHWKTFSLSLRHETIKTLNAFDSRPYRLDPRRSAQVLAENCVTFNEKRVFATVGFSPVPFQNPAHHVG